jgi:hypothetical protein
VVLECSPWAHNTNSAYSKTMLCIARYYTTKCLGTSFFFFFFISTIYNAVLERSLWAHNTNSTYSKTTLRIARYYTTKRLGTSFWQANAGRSPQIFHYDVALSSGEKVEAPPPGPAHTVASHRIALGRSPDRNPSQRVGQSPEGVEPP